MKNKWNTTIISNIFKNSQSMMGTTRFKTNGFNGYGVEFSPFFENRLAVASAANFGIVGNGRLWVLRNNQVEQM